MKPSNSRQAFKDLVRCALRLADTANRQMESMPRGSERIGMDEAANLLDKADVAAVLRCGSLLDALENGEPLVVLAGDPARLVYATDAAFAQFGRKTPSSLEKLLIGQESPGARRLRALLASGGSAPQRVEH